MINKKCPLFISNQNMFLLFRKTIAKDGVIDLTPEESRHARARRLAPGDEVFLGDGLSRRYRGQLVDRTKALIDQDRVHEQFTEPVRILLTAIPDRNRWEWLLQKSTEAGVTRIQPVLFARSQDPREEFSPHSRTRAERILREAASQSRRFFLPVLHDPIPGEKIGEWLSIHQPEEESMAGRYLCKGGPVSELGDLWREQNRPTHCSLVIGPEGGLTEQEIEQLQIVSGFAPVTLGAYTLRVETAALIALGALPPLGDVERL